MKWLLIFMNILLAVGLAAVGLRIFGGAAESPLTLGKDRSAKSENRSAGRTATPDLPESMTAAQTVTAQNVFALDRCPSLATSSGTRESQMTLVGVYVAGTLRGAVILQNSRTNEAAGMMTMMMGPGGGRGDFAPPWANRRQQVQAEQKTAVQQFFRVGEMLPNGWTLTAVSATNATLSRNGSDRVLELEAASKNLGTATVNSGGNGRRQQQQQMQMMQQMMMFQMMRMNMDRGGRNNPRQDGGASPRGGNAGSSRGGAPGGNGGGRGGR